MDARDRVRCAVYYDVIQAEHMDSDDLDREEERRRRRTEREAWREARREERRRAWEEETEARRKERVLHTRVSERLAEDIRRVAGELRVPVSNVVRNVLEDVFSVVEAVTDNVGDLVEEVLEEADRARSNLWRRGLMREGAGEPEGREKALEEEESPRAPELPEFPDVVGWQPLLLNAPQTCAGCARELRRGGRGYVALRSTGLSSTYLCVRCASGVAGPG
jgi:hypothetical protein